MPEDGDAFEATGSGFCRGVDEAEDERADWMSVCKRKDWRPLVRAVRARRLLHGSSACRSGCAAEGKEDAGGDRDSGGDGAIVCDRNWTWLVGKRGGVVVVVVAAEDEDDGDVGEKAEEDVATEAGSKSRTVGSAEGNVDGEGGRRVGQEPSSRLECIGLPGMSLESTAEGVFGPLEVSRSWWRVPSVRLGVRGKKLPSMLHVVVSGQARCVSKSTERLEPGGRLERQRARIVEGARRRGSLGGRTPRVARGREDCRARQIVGSPKRGQV